MYVQRTCGKTPRQNVGCFYMHAIKNYFFLGFFLEGEGNGTCFVKFW